MERSLVVNKSSLLSITKTSTATYTFSMWFQLIEEGAVDIIPGVLSVVPTTTDNGQGYNVIVDRIAAAGVSIAATLDDRVAFYHLLINTSGIYLSGTKISSTVPSFTVFRLMNNGTIGTPGYIYQPALIIGQSLPITSFTYLNPHGELFPLDTLSLKPVVDGGTGGFLLDFTTAQAAVDISRFSTAVSTSGFVMTAGDHAYCQSRHTPKNRFGVMFLRGSWGLPGLGNAPNQVPTNWTPNITDYARLRNGGFTLEYMWGLKNVANNPPWPSLAPFARSGMMLPRDRPIYAKLKFVGGTYNSFEVGIFAPSTMHSIQDMSRTTSNIARLAYTTYGKTPLMTRSRGCDFHLINYTKYVATEYDYAPGNSQIYYDFTPKVVSRMALPATNYIELAWDPAAKALYLRLNGEWIGSEPGLSDPVTRTNPFTSFVVDAPDFQLFVSSNHGTRWYLDLGQIETINPPPGFYEFSTENFSEPPGIPRMNVACSGFKGNGTPYKVMTPFKPDLLFTSAFGKNAPTFFYRETGSMGFCALAAQNYINRSITWHDDGVTLPVGTVSNVNAVVQNTMAFKLDAAVAGTGTIPSTRRSNPLTGISVVQFTGTGADGTIDIGLPNSEVGLIFDLVAGVAGKIVRQKLLMRTYRPDTSHITYSTRYEATALTYYCSEPSAYTRIANAPQIQGDVLRMRGGLMTSAFNVAGRQYLAVFMGEAEFANYVATSAMFSQSVNETPFAFTRDRVQGAFTIKHSSTLRVMQTSYSVPFREASYTRSTLSVQHMNLSVTTTTATDTAINFSVVSNGIMSYYSKSDSDVSVYNSAVSLQYVDVSQKYAIARLKVGDLY